MLCGGVQRGVYGCQYAERNSAFAFTHGGRGRVYGSPDIGTGGTGTGGTGGFRVSYQRTDPAVPRPRENENRNG